ncbi:hypothetical protein GGR55DRAFT_226775 [Xylaria sp. FL0064]|nr:hypothetical protein GGR55DRAFT_226775 [Xylaria sp. FL0064]
MRIMATCTETISWQQQYAQPYRKRKNVECHDGHRHRNNVPAVGLVLVRLNASSQIELLLDNHNVAIAAPGTYACIGGLASSRGEQPMTTARREAEQEFLIEVEEVKPFPMKYKRDHGGYKYLNYTYIFAEYNPKDGRAPMARSSKSRRSEWFTLDALPGNLTSPMQEDLPALEQILKICILPHLLEQKARRLTPPRDPSLTHVSSQNPQPNITNVSGAGKANKPVVQYPKFPSISSPGNDTPSQHLDWSANTWSLDGIPRTDASVSSADNGDVDSNSTTSSMATLSLNNTPKKHHSGVAPGIQAPITNCENYKPRPRGAMFAGESRYLPENYGISNDENDKAAAKKGLLSGSIKSPCRSSSKPDTQPAASQELDQGKIKVEDQGNTQQEDLVKVKQEDQDEIQVAQGKEP